VFWASFRTKVELDQGLFALIAGGVRLSDGCASRPHGTGAQQRQKVAFENQAQDEQDNHAAQTQVYSARSKAAAAPFIAAVFNVIAASTWCPPHV